MAELLLAAITHPKTSVIGSVPYTPPALREPSARHLDRADRTAAFVPPFPLPLTTWHKGGSAPPPLVRRPW